jgi:hypothetical protein
MSEELKLGIEIFAFFVTIGTILWRLSAATTTFTLIGVRQADEIREIKIAMEKMETAVTAIAIQDVKLTAMSTRQDLTDKRVDERFTRLETMLDELRHGRGMINNNKP